MIEGLHGITRNRRPVSIRGRVDEPEVVLTSQLHERAFDMYITHRRFAPWHLGTFGILGTPSGTVVTLGTLALGLKLRQAVSWSVALTPPSFSKSRRAENRPAST